MKTALILLSIFLVSNLCPAQGGTWVWVKGSNSINTPASYGTQGVPALSNNPQGLYEAASWIDQQGNFWIFGGNYEQLTELNINSDLWRYQPATNTWTWMNGPGIYAQNGVYGTMGVPSPTNYPGSRSWGAITWTDNNDDLWFFGGAGFDSSGSVGSAGDLWRYHIATNEWTWMGGASTSLTLGPPVYGTQGQASATNSPGERWEDNSSWTDAAGNLWFFGGANPIRCNDLWMFNPNTNEWTWVKGPQNDANQAGNFGAMGVENASNLPPACWTYTNWKDAAGNFYVWGGLSATVAGDYSGVWKYKPTTNNWIWVAGEQGVNSPGNYNQYCTDNESTGPRARMENRTPHMLACTNMFYTFGGENINDNDAMNDLWLFNSQTDEWHWLSGSAVPGSTGNYGTMGVSSPGNMPPARVGPSTWVDSSGVLWVFGGMTNWNTAGSLNDMWKFIPDEACTGPVLSSINYQLTENEICQGDTAHLSLSGLSNPQISPDSHIQWIDSLHVNIFPDVTTSYLLSGTSQCRSHDSALITIYILPSPQITFTASGPPLCNGDSVNICTTANYPSYHWSTGQTTRCIYVHQTNNYTVTISGSNGCTSQATDTVVFRFAAPISVNSINNITCPGDSDRFCATPGFVSYLWSTGDTGICTYVNRAGLYSVTITDTTGCTNYASDSAVFYPFIQLQFDTVSPLCFGNSNGSIAALATGGFVTTGFTYSWSDSAGLELGQNNAIVNLAAGEYYVTVTDNARCTKVDSVLLRQPDSLMITNITSKNISCYNYNDGSLIVNAAGGTAAIVYSDNGGISYQLSPVFKGLLPGNYTLSIRDSNGCNTLDSDQASITQPAAIGVGISTNISGTLKFGDSIQLQSVYNPFVVFPVTTNWKPDYYLSCDTCTSTEARPLATTTYTLVITDSNGCNAKDTFTVYVSPNNRTFFVPNAFTPNNDGHNDVFCIYASGVQYINCYIFDRWGEKMDEFHSINDGWDGDYKGKKAPEAVYTYELEIVFLDGSLLQNKGSITLLR